MDFDLGMSFGGGVLLAASAPPAPAYHPNDDLLAAELYAIAEPANITAVGGKADTLAWTGALAHIFKQGTDGNRPVVTAVGNLNGKPCLTFDGSDDFMLARNSANSADIPLSSFMAVGGISTVIVVCRPAAIASNDATASANDHVIGDDAGGVWGMALRNSATKVYRPWLWDGSTESTAVDIVTPPSGNVLLYRKDTATTFKASVNGGAESSVGPHSDPGPTSLAGKFRIGHGVTGLGTPFNGELYLVAGFKSDLGAVAAAAIVLRLKTFYGL